MNRRSRVIEYCEAEPLVDMFPMPPQIVELHHGQYSSRIACADLASKRDDVVRACTTTASQSEIECHICVCGLLIGPLTA
jgi:hypothetical protein